MRPVKSSDANSGGRAGIVLNGSPLFTGGAGSGESEIRRHLIESDLVDAIVALPTNMFYNTGIATYVWILDNHKPAERRGKIQLIDATSRWTKLRKNLGSKNREISDADRAEIVKIYDDFTEGEQSKILEPDDFGYWEITVEQPLLDDEGEPVTDRKGKPKPDSKKRDTESVPFTYGLAPDDDDRSVRSDEGASRSKVIEAYFDAEVAPHVPDAWIDHSKTKVGFEIPFTRQFYVYEPPRPVEEIAAEIRARLADVTVVEQRGEDFAERLVGAHADAAAATGHPVLQIGMDTPQVDPALLTDALDLAHPNHPWQELLDAE